MSDLHEMRGERGSDGWMNVSPSVSRQQIEEERRLGWVNFHPEDYCHRCGRPNISWYVSNDEWSLAVDVIIPLILCPQCFVAAWEAVTGFTGTWELHLDPATDQRLRQTRRDTKDKEN